MDYERFYAEVVDWIGRTNQMAVQHGIGNEQFWYWVTSSVAEICKRYDDNPLVIKQMMMLTDWLEEVYERQHSGPCAL